VEDSEKGSGEVALVVEAAVHGDCGDGFVALAEGGAGLLDPVAIEVLDRGEVKALFEVSLESAEGEAAFLGHVDQFDFVGVVGCDVFDRSTEGGVVQRACIAFELSGHSRQAANVA